MKTCKQCGKELTRKQRIYCSLSCAGKGNVIYANLWHETPYVEHTCPCGKTFLIREWKSRKGRGKYCSHRCSGIFSHLKKRKLDFSHLSQEEIGYLAGILDGEGCITCSYTQAGRLYVGIGNTDKTLMNWLTQKLPCGKVVTHRKARGNYKKMYNWMIKCVYDCYQFLMFIEPHLIIKRQKAQKVIKFLRDRYHFD